MHSLCGIRDAITFKEIDQTLINQVETFVQTELGELLEKWKSSGIEINEADFFGNIYVHSPKSFKFTIGDRMQIQSMVNYVKMKYDENGIEFSGAHHFDPPSPPKKKVKLNCENKKLKCFFGDNTSRKTATGYKCANNPDDDVKQALIDKIAKMYKKKV